MDKKTKLKYLKAARKKIEKPENWCKGRFAVVSGKFFRFGVDPKSKDATAWCAVGALYSVTDDRSVISLLNCFGEVIPTNHTLSTWNDNPNVKHEDVLALYDRAIEAAKKE